MNYSLIFCFLFLSCSQIKLESIPKETKPLRHAWIKNLDPVYNTGNFPIGTSSPFVHEDIVYMGNLKGEMIAYDLATGREHWKFNEKFPIQSKANFYANHIYYGNQSGRLFARHYVSGKLKYAIDLGSPIESQPIFVQGRAIIHLRNHTIISLDAKTGKIFWRYKRSIPYLTTLQRVSKVLSIKNKIVVGFADGNIVSLTLEEGVVDWEQKISQGIKFVDVDVRPTKFGKYLVAGSASGPMRFLNPISGVIEKTVELVQSHDPLITKNGILVGDVYGDIYLVDQYGKILKRKNLTTKGISSIVEYKSQLAVSTMGAELFYINKESFEVIQKINLGNEQSAIFGDMVVSEGYLAFYSSRNRLYVFK